MGNIPVHKLPYGPQCQELFAKYYRINVHIPIVFFIPLTKYQQYMTIIKEFYNCISGIIVSVLALSAADCGFEHKSGETKEYKIAICCFSAKHVALRRKSKD